MPVMKKLIVTAILAVWAIAAASAQKLMIGEKVPELKVGEWINDRPAQGTARLIEFFHSSDNQLKERLSALDRYAKKYEGLTIILISREGKAAIERTVLSSPRGYSIGADDEGKTFGAFGVQYVPFCVLTDSKGKVVWFGNPSGLEEATIESALK